MKKKSIKIFYQILKNTFLWKAICSYLLFFFAASVAILIVEPTIDSLGNALWYSFVSGTTIGFGDFTATGLFARILTVILYLYTMLIIALITAFFTQYFIELAEAKQDKSIALLQNDLEHLADLPKKRLEEISEIIRHISRK